MYNRNRVSWFHSKFPTLLTLNIVHFHKKIEIKITGAFPHWAQAKLEWLLCCSSSLSQYDTNTFCSLQEFANWIS